MKWVKIRKCITNLSYLKPTFLSSCGTNVLYKMYNVSSLCSYQINPVLISRIFSPVVIS